MAADQYEAAEGIEHEGHAQGEHAPEEHPDEAVGERERFLGDRVAQAEHVQVEVGKFPLILLDPFRVHPEIDQVIEGEDGGKSGKSREQPEKKSREGGECAQGEERPEAGMTDIEHRVGHP